MIVRNNVKQLRRLRGLTQSQFANLIGVSKIMVGHYERQTFQPSGETLLRICHALQIKPEDVLMFSEN